MYICIYVYMYLCMIILGYLFPAGLEKQGAVQCYWGARRRDRTPRPRPQTFSKQFCLIKSNELHLSIF